MRELGAFYRAARAKFDGDPAFADRARRRVVLLQAGDAETLAHWRRLIDVSVEHFSELYAALGVTLTPARRRGRERVQRAAARRGRGARGARASPGRARARCACSRPASPGRDGEPVPLIIRKQEGGYGYATTDLAALRQRVGELRARSASSTSSGTPQTQHLAMVFATARLAGWVDDRIRLEHVAFGSVLGADKKMLKTRAGDSVSLAELVERGHRTRRDRP